MDYQYTTLEPRSIRLLRLVPGIDADVLTGVLVTAPLDNVPDFTALSYAWGCPEPRQRIYLDGFPAKIGPELHSALKHLRSAGQATLIWADALCINQADVPERTQQVKIMAHIYAAARETAIWLGDESPEVARAFGHLRMAGDDFLQSATSRSGLPTPQETSGIFNSDHQAFRDICALLDRPWFSRKWIIQELVKSQEPVLMAGRKRLPWRSLAAWLLTLQFQWSDPALNIPKLCQVEFYMSASKHQRAAVLMMIAFHKNGHEPLLHLLAMTLEFGCKDVRDQVFALVGMASDAEKYDIIDYSERIETVCQRLAYASVSDSASLKRLWFLLYLTPLDRRVHSWVPNLENLLMDREGVTLSRQFTLFERGEHSASGHSALDTRLDKDRNTLTIRGRIVDKLRRLGSNSRGLDSARQMEKLTLRGYDRDHPDSLHEVAGQYLQWMEECIDIAQFAGRGRTKAEEAFRGALLHDLPTQEKALSMAGVLDQEFPEQLRLRKVAAYDNTGRAPAARITLSGLQSTPLIRYLMSDRVNRRFGRTEKDKIGWLPPVAEEGDLICVFHGMKMPYAIRPAGDGYQLVGECIIMGLMRGEGMDLPNVESEMIVLG